MKTKIQSIATVASITLCFSYLAGCSSSGDVWVKQSEMTHSMNDPQEVPVNGDEKLPDKTLKEGDSYEQTESSTDIK